MGHTETVTGNGNTDTPGYVTIAAGITSFVDEVDLPNTVQGAGQTNIAISLGANGSFAPVTYISDGGNGTVNTANFGDFASLSGAHWLFQGAATGGETVYTAANNSTVFTNGQGQAVSNPQDTTPSNVVSLHGTSALVGSDGLKDLIEAYTGHSTINVGDDATVKVFGGSARVNASNIATVAMEGGAATVDATGSGPVIAYFDSTGGGKLDFINNSTVSATVSGNIPGGSGGSLTVFGGVGGGVYIGGSGGNNSLVGGSGAVTLIGAGNNNHLSVSGYSSSYAGQNVLRAGGGGAVMVAESPSGYNEFYGGSGTDTITSYGHGAQTYYVGTTGTERYTGSTVSGATNEYIFDQDTSGSGNDIITNFRLGTDHIDVNLNGTLSGVTIRSIEALTGTHTGSVVLLSNQTTIQLYGVSTSALSVSIIGGTHI
jgi:hypothetical protein